MAFQKRSQDLAESYHLLLELLTSEPFLQECFQMVDNMCLSHDLEFTVGGKRPAPEFKAFVDRHYYAFLSNVMRQAQSLRFVVWCVRKLPSGDKMPEVLPFWSFTWTVEPDPSGQRSLLCKVQLVSIKEIPFVVTEWLHPNLRVHENSILHATVPVNGTRPIKAPVTRMAIFQPGIFYLENYWVS
jgi:hypothetical protein